MSCCTQLAFTDVSLASTLLRIKFTRLFRFRLRNTKREDFTFLAFQIWVLGMSMVALLNESIPHMYVYAPVPSPVSHTRGPASLPSSPTCLQRHGVVSSFTI